MEPHYYTIYNIIKRNSRIYNNRTALIFENKRISHLQFLEIVDRLASGLLRMGLKKETGLGSWLRIALSLFTYTGQRLK